MVNWQEAGRTWPRPHPHAAQLLLRLVWDQHYRHSHPQCEGGMPRSFELRTDIAPDRLQAVEDWLRAEGYQYRHQQRRWRTWTRPDRPGKGLRPDGIEEDEDPNAYPSGASINVSMWDLIEKKFPEPGSERRLQGSSSPFRRKRSGPPGTRSGTGSGGSTRSPWPPKPPKAPRAEPQPPVPNGPMVVTTPATPPLVTSWQSPRRPGPSPVRCS